MALIWRRRGRGGRGVAGRRNQRLAAGRLAPQRHRRVALGLAQLLRPQGLLGSPGPTADIDDWWPAVQARLVPAEAATGRRRPVADAFGEAHGPPTVSLVLGVIFHNSN